VSFELTGELGIETGIFWLPHFTPVFYLTFQPELKFSSSNIRFVVGYLCFQRYTFCGLATLALINRVDVLDLPSLVVRFMALFLGMLSLLT
jgi:hypothetical protein